MSEAEDGSRVMGFMFLFLVGREEEDDEVNAEMFDIVSYDIRVTGKKKKSLHSLKEK